MVRRAIVTIVLFLFLVEFFTPSQVQADSPAFRTALSWAGYVKSSTAINPNASVAITEVRGQWIVPQLPPDSSSTSTMDTWVGVDGCGNSQYLLQAGTTEAYS